MQMLKKHWCEGGSLQHTIEMFQTADLAIASPHFEATVGKDLHDK